MIRPIRISILTLAVCLGGLSAQGLPDWVEDMPQDSDYYWARESVGVSGLSEEEFKNKANAQALRTISMQIRTTVSGQVLVCTFMLSRQGTLGR